MSPPRESSGSRTSGFPFGAPNASRRGGLVRRLRSSIPTCSPAGTDRLAGIITNRQSVPLEDAILAFGKQVYLLGTIAPGATVRVELTSDRNLSGLLKDKQRNYLSDQPWNRDRRIDRADLMLAAMFHDSQSTLSTETDPRQRPPERPRLDRAACSLRPMLVARIKRPAHSSRSTTRRQLPRSNS